MEVYAVPPLPRRRDARRTIDFDAAEAIVRHIAAGGVSRFIYGGNAFLYHLTLAEYESLVAWLAAFPDERWAIPSIGPSFGRAIDQAPLVRAHAFPCVMVLPCTDPRDASGLEAGLREIACACGVPLMLYLKSEDAFGSDRHRGLDVVGRLVADGICTSIKYAVVRRDPSDDAYLQGLLARVDPARVISGIGERPAIVHLRDFALSGFTTGSGCIAPRRSRALLAAADARDWARAEAARSRFIPLEDLRDRWGPARVLHHAAELAGIAATGPIPPYVSALDQQQIEELRPVARELLEADA
jgi:dihydrodipicolinate synthase/N-acetylneuraminate lyase